MVLKIPKKSIKSRPWSTLWHLRFSKFNNHHSPKNTSEDFNTKSTKKLSLKTLKNLFKAEKWSKPAICLLNDNSTKQKLKSTKNSWKYLNKSKTKKNPAKTKKKKSSRKEAEFSRKTRNSKQTLKTLSKLSKKKAKKSTLISSKPKTLKLIRSS